MLRRERPGENRCLPKNREKLGSARAEIRNCREVPTATEAGGFEWLDARVVPIMHSRYESKLDCARYELTRAVQAEQKRGSDRGGREVGSDGIEKQPKQVVVARGQVITAGYFVGRGLKAAQGEP